MIAAADEGRIRSLFIVGENPMLSYPDRRRVKRALEGLDFLVVSDIFPTQTTDLAHVILPAASFAEKDGTFTSTERRIQRIRQALPPIGESRPEWMFLSELLNLVGVPAGYSSPADIMDEISSVTPIYGGVHYDRLGTAGLQWPCPDRDHPGTGIMHSQKFSSGLGRFRAVEHRGPVETPDHEYPLMLTTGRSLYHFHTGTMTRRVSLLDREVPAPVVDINPVDSEALGIRNGQAVQIETRRGKIVAEARVTDQVSRGVIFMPFHFDESPANELTSNALDPSSRIPEFKASAARIKRLP
jgi:predicted molibdopterin-dependent oxidoreductase YjgC